MSTSSVALYFLSLSRSSVRVSISFRTSVLNFFISSRSSLSSLLKPSCDFFRASFRLAISDCTVADVVGGDAKDGGGVVAGVVATVTGVAVVTGAGVEEGSGRGGCLRSGLAVAGGRGEGLAGCFVGGDFFSGSLAAAIRGRDTHRHTITLSQPHTLTL